MAGFWEKVRCVGETLVATGDYKAVTPTLREIVAIVKAHPESAEQFEAAFVEILENPRTYSVLVVQYCMHTLRLGSVLRHVAERIRHDTHRTDMHARHVLEAYSSDWALKSLFEVEPSTTQHSPDLAVRVDFK
jgi:uncharacterized protein (DUF2062 family)